MNDIPFAYLTTTGRRTGTPHRIEIWFARHEHTLYFLAGAGRASDWVANLIATPRVHIEVGDLSTPATARLITDPAEDTLARDLVFEKYQPGYGGDLTDWRARSLPVAVDLPN